MIVNDNNHNHVGLLEQQDKEFGPDSRESISTGCKVG